MDLRKLILGADDRKREAVVVPEWKDGDGNPVTVHVFEMSATQRSTWVSSLPRGEEHDMVQLSRMLVYCLCDEQGKPIFQATDIEALGEKNADVILRLYGVAWKLNGLGGGAVEEAEKNS